MTPHTRPATKSTAWEKIESGDSIRNFYGAILTIASVEQSADRPGWVQVVYSGGQRDCVWGKWMVEKVVNAAG